MGGNLGGKMFKKVKVFGKFNEGLIPLKALYNGSLRYFEDIIIRGKTAL